MSLQLYVELNSNLVEGANISLVLKGLVAPDTFSSSYHFLHPAISSPASALRLSS